MNGEDRYVREYLERESIAKLGDYVCSQRTLIVDEAQHIQQTGLNLKLLVDHVEGLRMIASNSSSFEIAQVKGEPLTGRRSTLLLLPLAQLELKNVEEARETTANLEDGLRSVPHRPPANAFVRDVRDREQRFKLTIEEIVLPVQIESSLSAFFSAPLARRLGRTIKITATASSASVIGLSTMNAAPS